MDCSFPAQNVSLLHLLSLPCPRTCTHLIVVQKLSKVTKMKRQMKKKMDLN